MESNGGFALGIFIIFILGTKDPKAIVELISTPQKHQ